MTDQRAGDLRAEFPILAQDINGHPLIYFDNAATSQKPLEVIAAITHYYERDNSNVHRGIHELSNRATRAFEAAREAVAGFVGARPEETVFTRGTTDSINLVARAWGDENVGPGDVILLTEMEHHSNLLPWQMLAARRGASLRFVPVDGDGRLDLSNFESLLAGPVKIFAFTHISNTLGTINPAADLCARARAAGVTTLVDCAQSAGHLPVDAAELGCDFIVFSGHKMCGPTGIGVLVGRGGILDRMPPFEGGGEMVESAFYNESKWKQAPARFEAGTPPIAEAIGLGAAVGFLNRVGRDFIAAHDASIVGHALEIFSTIPGLHILGPPDGRSALVSFVIDGVHAQDIVSFANASGLALRAGHHCTQPLLRKLGIPASARASFYLYNTHDEVARAAAILRRIRDLLA